jgi:hypothetical protein
MPRVGFEPTTPMFERAKTVHSLDSVAIVFGDDTTLKTTNINFHRRENLNSRKETGFQSWKSMGRSSHYNDICYGIATWLFFQSSFWEIIQRLSIFLQAIPRWGCQPYAPAALYPQEDSWYSLLLEATWLMILSCNILFWNSMQLRHKFRPIFSAYHHLYNTFFKIKLKLPLCDDR